MEFKKYIRNPFLVDACRITADNIDEVAGLVGELKVKDGTPFIILNRKIVPNVNRAYVGWFVTQLGDHYRVYSPKVFNDQFGDYADQVWFDFAPEASEEPDQVVEIEIRPREELVITGAAVTDDSDPTPPHGIERPAEALVGSEVADL